MRRISEVKGFEPKLDAYPFFNEHILEQSEIEASLARTNESIPAHITKSEGSIFLKRCDVEELVESVYSTGPSGITHQVGTIPGSSHSPNIGRISRNN